MKAPIYQCDCPKCKKGTVVVLDKGEIGECDRCGECFESDYDEHHELVGNPIHCWIYDQLKERENE